ncbi:uncharacterized protein EAF01_012031 [Botrytis porri]|uniref:uncharacterized protein n=1 Tax=Botrytis porri TaxID=87229 RepID=UPI0018FF47E4|nr:uncharacterized protein EAF01_012031 [Botrytis porri]KAF7880270.1 hypothetical protein EAF01_012031 [Botrytis porri]
MDNDHKHSREIRQKSTTWKAKVGSIGHSCQKKKSLKRTQSSAKKAATPIDSCLTQGDNDELENQCGTIFHPFSRLPIELRLKIWKMSWESRNIGIVTRIDYVPTGHGTVTDVKRLASPPPTMSVNRESRAETLLHYKPLNLAPLALGHLVSQFYFNYELDTLAVYMVGVTKWYGSKLYPTHAGITRNFFNTAAALRNIRSLLVIPYGVYGYYQVVLSEHHEVHTNHASAHSYLYELILLADSFLEGITYNSPNRQSKLIPFGYTPLIPGHLNPVGQQFAQHILVDPSSWEDTKSSSYGMFRLPGGQGMFNWKSWLIKKFRLKLR